MQIGRRAAAKEMLLQPLLKVHFMGVDLLAALYAAVAPT